MQNWKFAISSIMSHKLRSFLTMVGIIIGVASVVVIMALGDGMKAGVTKTYTKDQEYVQISYSPNKSGYVTGINIGPSEDTGEGGGESGPAAEDRGMAAPSDIDGEHEEEYDEHVWTSPKNTMEIVEGLNKRMCALDKNHASKFNKNTENYIEQIASVDYSFKQVVKNAKRKDIVVGDRFPLLYFAKEYGLTYSAAFPGCSEQTEPSAATISYLIDKVKRDHNPAIFKIELSNGQIARTISEETGTKILTIQSMHNVSAEDFNNGETYVSIMRKNVKAVKEALQ